MKTFLNRTLFLTAFFAEILIGQGDVQIQGIVKDAQGAPVPGAQIKLEHAGVSATSGADGRFSLGDLLNIYQPGENGFNALSPALINGKLSLSVNQESETYLSAFFPNGKEIVELNRQLEVGQNFIELPHHVNGLVFFKITNGKNDFSVKAHANGGQILALESEMSYKNSFLLKKQAATVDVLEVTKEGYLDFYLHITETEASNLEVLLTKEGVLEPFSFFVTSLRALQELSESEDGFGGDFRFGETGPGSGLRGADKICAAIAERSMPGGSAKGWRAFLSATDDGNGEPVNAADRIGEGPWYDRVGRIVSENKTALLNVRPEADEAIINDLPNENGIPNQDPELTGPVDNHHTLTASNEKGELYGNDLGNTCNDWTSAEAEAGSPRVGLSWPRGGPGGPSGGGAGSNWISAGNAYGCAPGVALIQDGPGNPAIHTVGEGGGYGGFYCFALNP